MSKTKTTALPKGTEKIDLDAVRKFITAAIKVCQKNKPKKFAGKKGVHTVFDGFNAMFEKHFGFEPFDLLRPANNKDKKPAGDLIADGSFYSHFTKGGVMIYLPEEAPAQGEANSAKTDAALAEVLAMMK